MKLVFAEHAWEDYLHWQKTDRKMLERINTLIRDIVRSPFEGLGKLEPLRNALSGSGRAGSTMSIASCTRWRRVWC